MHIQTKDKQLQTQRKQAVRGSGRCPTLHGEDRQNQKHEGTEKNSGRQNIQFWEKVRQKNGFDC